MDIEEEFNETLEIPSEEDELVSSFNLSSDSSFYSSMGSTVNSTPTRTARGRGIGSPRGRGRRGRGTPRRIGFANPVTSNQCHVCNRRIKTDKGFRKHVYNHKLEECARRKPVRAELKEECLAISKKVVEEMKNAPVGDIPSREQFYSFVEKVCNKVDNPEFASFVDIVTDPVHAVFCESTKRTILPPTIKQEVRKALHVSLGEENVRQCRLSSLLLLVQDAEQSVLDLFLEEFCLKLITPIAASLIRAMREAPNDPHQQNVQKFQDFESLFNQQTLHRVSGYSLKAVLVKSRQYKNSKRWGKFREVVLGRLAMQGIAHPNHLSRDYWTALLSKKSLVFVNDNTLSFFVEVAKVMCYTEAPDGCLSKSSVLSNVTSSPSIMASWGTLVGDSLDEQDSLFLMRVLVLSLCGTFGKGIMLRRMNQLETSKSRGRVSGVALRGRLCR